MKKRSLLLGLSLMTAVSPVSLLAGPGHGNEEHSEGVFPNSRTQFLKVMVNNFPSVGLERAVKSVRQSRLS